MSPITRSYTVRLRDRGQITIPHELRDRLLAEGGDLLTLLQVDDLVVMMPRPPRLPALAEKFTAEMDKAGLSLADLLAGLAEERETGGRARLE
jgi:bifunctional DNA-binding transcriptional regulator/antitoxin component of YhaV-PrlF toxin-antitoxin module